MGKTHSALRQSRATKSKPKKVPARPELTPEQIARSEAFNQYIARSLGDTSGEQEETWGVLKKALDENRTSLRRRFRE